MENEKRASSAAVGMALGFATTLRGIEVRFHKPRYGGYSMEELRDDQMATGIVS